MPSIILSLTSALRARPCRGAAQLRPRRSARAAPPAQHRRRRHLRYIYCNITAFICSPSMHSILLSLTSALRARPCRGAAQLRPRTSARAAPPAAPTPSAPPVHLLQHHCLYVKSIHAFHSIISHLRSARSSVQEATRSSAHAGPPTQLLPRSSGRAPPVKLRPRSSARAAPTPWPPAMHVMQHRCLYT